MDIDPREFHRRTTDWFGANVERIPDDRWGGETPCTEWDVRTLVQHLVSEQLWLAPQLAGQTIAEVGDRLEGDLLGEDPRRAWRDAAKEAREAVDADGAMDATAHLSYGDTKGSNYVMEVATDLLVHGWDLARAIGADEHMDEDLVKLVYERTKPHLAALRASGMFGPEVTPPAGADRQTELLAMFGRVA